MDYLQALRQLLKENPTLALDAQRIYFEDSKELDNPEESIIKTNTYERVYKGVKAIVDQQVKA